MLTQKNIKIAEGSFSKIHSGLNNKDSKIFKINYNEKTFYAIVELKFSETTDDELFKEIYKFLEKNEIGQYDAIAYTDIDHIKLFLYGENNEFIQEVLYGEPDETSDPIIMPLNTELVIFGEEENRDINLNYQFRNEMIAFKLGDDENISLKPEASIYVENGTLQEVQVSDVDCTESSKYLKFEDGNITLTEEAISEFVSTDPIEINEEKRLPVTFKILIDSELKDFRTEVLIDIKNKEAMKSNIEMTKGDIEAIFVAVTETDENSLFIKDDMDFVANAVFELDERMMKVESRLGIEPGPLMSTQVLETRDTTVMAELWARWIQTNRRQLTQCPEQYKDIVIEILKSGHDNKRI